MRRETSVNGGSLYQEKFPAFGSEAIPPLMDLLTGTDLRARSFAGQAMWLFPHIDQRYLPVLIAEDLKGNPQGHLETGPGWLGHVIGRVGTDEAIAYLFDRMKEKPAGGIHNYVGPAILRNGQTILPHVRSRLENFPKDGTGAYLAILVELSNGGGEPFGWAAPEWVGPALVKIATSDIDPSVRKAAEYQLVAFAHPIAFAAVMRDAAESVSTLPTWDGESRYVSGEEWSKLVDGYYARMVRRIGGFGEVGSEAGSLIVKFFGRPDLPDTRAEAALAVGQIGYRPAVDQLLGMRQELDDDWLLAYNAVESLGRLRAAEAEEFLASLSREHWHWAVRNNAERALSMLGGGNFERLNVLNDGKPYADGDDGLSIGPFVDLRYAGDKPPVQAALSDCASDVDSDHGVGLSQSPPGRLSWPKRGYSHVYAKGVSRSSVPRFSDDLRKQLGRGDVIVLSRTSKGVLVGTNAGEFIGALDFVSAKGRLTRVIDDNVQLAFRMGGKLFVLTGLSHLTSSYGEVWMVDDSRTVPLAVRRIRLPAEASSINITDQHVVLFETEAGAVALNENGKLIDPQSLSVCTRE